MFISALKYSFNLLKLERQKKTMKDTRACNILQMLVYNIENIFVAKEKHIIINKQINTIVMKLRLKQKHYLPSL